MLRLSPQLLDRIRAHAERDYPHECCGILLGRSEPVAEAAPGADDTRRLVLDVAPMRNAHTASPQNRFEFDPREHLQVQRRGRERGLEVIGFYHSHPDHPARPSIFDLENASWPGLSYLIVAVAQARAAAANSFELAGDRSHFIQEELEAGVSQEGAAA